MKRGCSTSLYPWSAGEVKTGKSGPHDSICMQSLAAYEVPSGDNISESVSVATSAHVLE